MISGRFISFALASVVAAVVSCSNSAPVARKSAGAGGDGGGGPTIAASASSTSSSTSTSAGAGGCGVSIPACVAGLTPVASSGFCEEEEALVDCSRVKPADHAELCGIPLPTPASELARSASVKRFAGSGPAQVGCFAPAGYPAPLGTPMTAPMQGVARIFANGCQSTSLAIQVFAVNHACGSADATPGAPIGQMVTTDADCTATGVASPSMNCGTEYECTFSYPSVPTETELVIETSGDVWAPSYEYGVLFRNADVKAGVLAHDVLAIAADDYAVVAQATLGHPVAPGHGMVLGEVHDCGDVRVSNAVVNVDVAAEAMVYFTANEAQPLPDQSAKSTSALGLFGAIDVAPGPLSVAAAGLSSGAVTAVGFERIRVFPDAITTMRFRGPLPVMP